MPACLSVGMHVGWQHGAALGCTRRAYGVYSRTFGPCFYRPEYTSHGKNRVRAAAIITAAVVYSGDVLY